MNLLTIDDETLHDETNPDTLLTYTLRYTKLAI